MHAARVALQARRGVVIAQDARLLLTAWKLFASLPFMLLRRPRRQQKVDEDELRAGFDKFGSDQWEARHSAAKVSNRPLETNSIERRAEVALLESKFGDVSRARQCLVGAALALGTVE